MPETTQRVERLAAVLAEHEWYNAETAEAYGITARHSQHNFDAVCAICRGDLTRIAAALLPAVAEIEAEALRDAADEMDEFAAETYPEDIFRRPTSEQYAEINALLKRERGHQLDGIAADCMSRAIQVQANRLRERAVEVTDA